MNQLDKIGTTRRQPMNLTFHDIMLATIAVILALALFLGWGT